MKKTFPLQVEGKHPDRLLDAIKHDVRKYMKRERKRALPAGVDFWDFDCRFGATELDATVAHPAELIALIDAMAKSGASRFYLEILAKHGVRNPRAPSAASTIANFLEA
jgi:hypothetical protein